MGQTEEELATLEHIADQFPDHVVAKRAQAALRLLRGSDAAPLEPMAVPATSSSQVRRLRQSFLHYSAVSWALNLVLLVLVIALARDVGSLKARVAALARDYASLKAPARAAATPRKPAAAPAPRPAVPAPARARPTPAPPPPAPPAAAPSAPAGSYTVKSGDTLWLIAKRQLGDSGRVAEIARLNGLQEPYRLRVGDKLKLPARHR
jgi:nucleoid-associated protein YgaU